MRTNLFRCAVVLFAGISFGTLGWSMPDQEARISRLMSQLGSSKLSEREQAQQELATIGRPAKAWLIKTQQDSREPEVRVRVALLLAGIRCQEEELQFQKEDDCYIPPASDPGATPATDTSGTVLTFPGLRIETASREHGYIETGTREAARGFVVTSTVTDEAPTVLSSDDIRFEITHAEDTRGNPLTLETCDVCSPRLVLVKGPSGQPIKIFGKLRKRYMRDLGPVVFHKPYLGESKRRGRFTFTIQEGGVRIDSDEPVAPSELYQTIVSIDVAVKEELSWTSGRRYG